jgi:hypothetical protein
VNIPGADLETRDTGLGAWVADLPARRMARGAKVEFPFRWLQTGAWEGTNFVVEVR